MKSWHKILVVLVASLLFGTALISTASANPPLQDPRPPNGGNGETGDAGNGAGSGASSNPTCAALKGQVINWGVGGMGGVVAELKTGSWQVATASASDGNYGFGGLGVGVVKLHVVLPSGQTGKLAPVIQDAGIYLSCDIPLYVNIALFKGARINPPASITLSAPPNLSAGENTVIRLAVKNTLPNEITNVVVTNLMPNGLTALSATTANSGDDIRLIDGGAEGQLAYFNLNSLAAGAEENILLTVAVDKDLPEGAQIRNTATLFYKESAADQDWVDFTVGGAGVAPAGVPATAVPVEIETETTPQPEATAAPLPTSAPTITTTTTLTATAILTETAGELDEGENFVPPGDLPTTGDVFLPPPSLLPETGQELFAAPETLPNTGVSPLLPFSGVGLGGIAFLIHYLRFARRNRD